MDYNSENSVLLKNLLNIRFFDQWSKDFEDKDKFKTSDLELYITSECNLGCKYCYLHNFGSKLYPKDIRDARCIKKNLHLILQWIIDNNYKIDNLDLFSGEIWHIQFGIDILNIIYKYASNYRFIKHITIPSNMCFINDESQTNKIQEMIDSFKDIGVRLFFSASLDGLVVEDLSRPFKKDGFLRDAKFYDKVFRFVVKNNYGFHPMVSAYSIEEWVDNYNWWATKFYEYGLDITKLMMLEVRNNDWTYDKIEKYLDFLSYVVDYTYNICYNKDKYRMSEHIFNIDYKCNYNNIAIRKLNNGFSCKVQDELYIRLGDLAIVPCHRTSYDSFIYGKFVSDGNKIVDIQSCNPEIAIKILCGNPVYSQFKCGYCDIKEICSNGCLGSQYENSKEIFYPCNTVCDLYKNKNKFLIEKYYNMGLIDYAKNTDFKNIKNNNIVKNTIEYIEEIRKVL